jgi:putative transposase
VTERNGHRDRLLTTKAGELELSIPNLRKGSFFPSILEPRQRIDQALYAVVMEAYVFSVSTRSVDALVESMGAASGISKPEVSRVCAGLDERVTAFRYRALGQVVSRGDRGCHRRHRPRRPGGARRHVGDSDAETFWTACLRSL